MEHIYHVETGLHCIQCVIFTLAYPGWLFVYAVTHLTVLCHIRDGAGVVLSQIIAIMQQINKT